MTRIEKTVFISYRRTNLPWALFVYQNLTMHGYDVFFDYQSIDSGNFESVILDNIKARAHFIVILTPSALENCNKTEDWLRREIETAMNENRNIVPLMVENFDFDSTYAKEALTGKLSKLSNYNGLPVPNAYALEAMERLRERYLNKVLSEVPTSALQIEAQKITETQKSAANQAAPVKEEELSAQTWFERGYLFQDAGNIKEALRCYSKAIQLAPDFAEAYNNRGKIYADKGNLDRAIKDLSKSIRLKPDYAHAYNNRGSIHLEKGITDKAIKDYDKAIQLEPDYAGAYSNRGVAYAEKGNLELAVKDLEKAINLQPDKAEFYNNRGAVYADMDELDLASADYDNAIRLNPNNPTVYYNRAEISEQKKIYSKAIIDYQRYLKLGGGKIDDDQKEVEEKIKSLKGKMTKKKPAKKKSTKKSSTSKPK